MNFQIHCDHYLQDIHRTHATPEATPELSLSPNLQAFLEDVAVNYFSRDTVTFIPEPRSIDQIGRPDFIVRDGLLPIGYIEAEAYGRNLNNLTGHAEIQNARFIENLDNFIEFRLYTDGQLRLKGDIENNREDLDRLLDRFLSAGPLQIGTPETLAKHLALRKSCLFYYHDLLCCSEISRYYL